MQDITKATLPELLAEQEAAVAAATAAKARTANVKAELQRRYSASATMALGQAGKDHGTVSLPLQDGFKVKADVKQTVKWDSGKLMAIAQTLPWERVEALFKIEFSMPEKIYAGVSALSPDLRAKIDEARTTTVAAPAITLIKED